MPSLLLLSSSTIHGSGYLDHAAAALTDFFQPGTEVLFLPWALHDADAYTKRAAGRFETLGIPLRSLHGERDARAAIDSARGFFVGGGNTFRLLQAVRDRGLLDPLRERVISGASYAGSSAGINLACPTIRTTNDMPIVEPGPLDALALLPFQINPHYLDPDSASTHRGETREERIRQFHEEAENRSPVLGLREPGILRREGERLTLEGGPARLFRRGRDPEEIPAGSDLSDLL